MKLVTVKSTESKNGGFVTSLSYNATVKTAFGEQLVKRRYYTKTLENVPVDTEFDINISDFDVQSIKSELTNTETGEIESRSSDWLIPKPQ